MSETLTMSAEPRERAGKGAARATRRLGRVPAVIYGDKKDPVMVSLDPIELMKHMRSASFYTHILEMQVSDSKETVLPRDVQLHPVTDEPLHVDFLRIGKGSKVTVTVPVIFINDEQAPGIKKGGVLNVVRTEVELRCNPTDIPEQITIDLDGREIGDSIRISDAGLGDEVELTITDRDFMLASIAAPTVATEESGDEAAEAASEDAADETSEG